MTLIIISNIIGLYKHRMISRFPIGNEFPFCCGFGGFVDRLPTLGRGKPHFVGNYCSLSTSANAVGLTHSGG